MPRSTGPILAVGAITIVNRTIVHEEPMDWRIPVMTGVAAGAFALLEKGWEEGAVAVAYIALVTVLFTRLQPGIPAPLESLVDWIGK